MASRIRKDTQLDRRDYRRLVPALRDDLLAAQLDARKLAKFSHRRDRHGRSGGGTQRDGQSSSSNGSIRSTSPCARSARTDANTGHPTLWRYWRTLPAYGRIAFYFWGWYGEYMGSELHDSRKGKRRARRQLERIRQLETMLGADGVRVIKIHLDLDAATQQQRLKKLRADKLTRWRVTHEDLRLARHHKAFRKAIERCLAASDQPAARWHLIDGADENFREVRVGRDPARRDARRLAACAEAGTCTREQGVEVDGAE